MNALVLYDSRYGNTERIAEAIALVVQEAVPTRLASIGEVDDCDEMLRDVDLLVIGGYAVFAQDQWTQGTVTTSATRVSCRQDGSCVAVDNAGGYLTYQQGTWSAVTKIDGNNTFNALSCSATTSCVGADANNNILVYAPSNTG